MKTKVDLPDFLLEVLIARSRKTASLGEAFNGEDKVLVVTENEEFNGSDFFEVNDLEDIRGYLSLQNRDYGESYLLRISQSAFEEIQTINRRYQAGLAAEASENVTNPA